MLSGGRRMLIHNEQKKRLSLGELIVYQDKAFVITGFEHSSSPSGLWALLLEEDGGCCLAERNAHNKQKNLTNKVN